MSKKIDEKCPVCHSKKATRYCERKKCKICSICCGTHCCLRCPPYCDYFKVFDKPQFYGKAHFTSADTNIKYSLPSDEYIPQVFMMVGLEIDNFDTYCIDTNTIKISIVGKIYEIIPKILDHLYLKEEWKKEYFDFEIENKELIAPIFSIFHDTDLYILGEETHLVANDFSEKIKLSANKQFLILPESFPRFSGLPKRDKKFVMYYGNQTVLYANPKKMSNNFKLDLTINKLGESYTSDKRSISMPFFITIPFFKVLVKKISLKGNPFFKINNSSKICSIIPMVQTELSGLENLTSTLLPPGYKDKILRAGGIDNQWNVLDIPQNLTFEKIHTYGFIIQLEPIIEEILFALKVTNDPIPISLYEYLELNQIISLPLAIMHITNTTSNPIRLIVESTIENISDKSFQTIDVSQYNQQIIELKPQLKHNSELPTDTFQTQIKIKVEKVSGSEKTTIFEQSEKIRILPKNSMIWETALPNGITQKLVQYIAIWVTPNHPSIDNVISNILGKGDINAFYGANVATTDEVNKQIEVIYQELSNIPLRYVQQQIVLGSKNPSESQRINYPCETIQKKFGNCLDLTVLFASLLERIGINPEIIFIEGHAFLGWEYSESEKGYLECTYLGLKSFKDATDTGKRLFIEFVKDRPSSHNCIINIKKMRERKIFPLINSIS